jgi:hypothetical protein
MGSTRLFGSVSLLAVRSFLHREMFFGSNMRAAEVGIVFWKKLRSNMLMARFTGGENMSFEDIETAWFCCAIRDSFGRLFSRE